LLMRSAQLTGRENEEKACWNTGSLESWKSRNLVTLLHRLGIWALGMPRE
jgi:hypothetical protein